MKQIIVEEINTNTRLDSYIASKIENMSRECVQRLIEEEKITVKILT